jgi:hypothetical protein
MNPYFSPLFGITFFGDIAPTEAIIESVTMTRGPLTVELPIVVGIGYAEGKYHCTAVVENGDTLDITKDSMSDCLIEVGAFCTLRLAYLMADKFKVALEIEALTSGV